MKFTKPGHRNSLLGIGCWVLDGNALVRVEGGWEAFLKVLRAQGIW